MPSSAIRTALIAKLTGDSTLRSLLPDGVYFSEAPAGLTAFCVVSTVTGEDEHVFGGRAIERPLYIVKAVVKAKASGNAVAAGDRIDALLQDGTLSITGYNFMDCVREEPIEDVEVDDLDSSIRWQHNGGFYRVQASLIGA